jgi:hypothetical protein
VHYVHYAMFNAHNYPFYDKMIMYMAAISLLATLLYPTSIVSVKMVDIIDYTHIVIKDVLNGSYYSSIRQKPNQGKNKFN